MSKSDVPILVNDFQKFIRSFLGLDKIIITADIPNQYTFGRTQDVASIRYREPDGNFDDVVLPFVAHEQYRYWIAIHFDFLKGSKPKHISIKFFSGMNKDFIQPIFRADFTDNNTGSTHGQPHWHFYFWDESKKKQTDGDFEQFMESEGLAGTLGTDDQTDERNEAQTVLQQSLSKINKIHFCMSSKWLENKGSIYSLESTKHGDVIHWLKETVEYVKGQINYIHGV